MMAALAAATTYYLTLPSQRVFNGGNPRVDEARACLPIVTFSS